MVNAPQDLEESTHNKSPIEWAVSTCPVPYDDAVAFMEARAHAIAEGQARQLVWLLEHPALYSAGTSAKPTDLRDAARFPVFKTGRGGQYTYHGPGQRVAYLMLDLRPRGRDVRAFVASIEHWVIAALDRFNVTGEMRCGRVGVWVRRTDTGEPDREDKIAAIGLRVRKWISLHGISINVEPDLSHFDGIIPCGITAPGLGVTSLVDLGLPVTMADVDDALKAAFQARFGPLVTVAPPFA